MGNSMYCLIHLWIFLIVNNRVCKLLTLLLDLPSTLEASLQI
jgi:hypothetical protein